MLPTEKSLPALATKRVSPTNPAELQQMLDEYYAKSAKISTWLADLIEEDIPPTKLQQSLSNGKFLTFIADKKHSFSCFRKHIWPRNADEEIQNIQMFLDACRKDLGIPAEYHSNLFSIDDVRTPVGEDPSRMLRVIDCIEYVSDGFTFLTPEIKAKIARRKAPKRQFDLGRYLFLKGGDMVARVEISAFKKMLLLLDIFKGRDSLPMDVVRVVMKMVVESSIVWIKLLRDIASNSNGSVFWTSEGFYVSGHREELEFAVSGKASSYNSKPLFFQKASWRDDIVQIVSSVHHTLIVLKTGEVYCAGLNTKGELGLGHAGYSTDHLHKSLRTGNDIHVVYASAGGNYSYLVDSNHNIYSSGDNEYGQLGLGSIGSASVSKFTAISATSPKDLLEGFPYQIACGARHVLILTSQGKVFGAGCNTHCELGLPGKVNQFEFVLVPFPEAISAVACGGSHSLALGKSGAVYSAGSCSHGQLGRSYNYLDGSFQKVVVESNPAMKFTDISCGYDYSMILSTDGFVFGCGTNFHGQLGIEVGIPLGAKYYDAATTREEFTRAKVDGVFQLSTGWTHTLLLTRYGLLGCGQSRDNALGLAKFIATDDITYFMQIPVPGLLDYV